MMNLLNTLVSIFFDNKIFLRRVKESIKLEEDKDYIRSVC